ncbi:flippase activity-associated protein Agl23 [Halolamina sediminis]|uniref:flippase activity-associated protein Agl23 n=1 Tax=Halolamina sediminis TaxID=1480675 RepID=UPI0006B6548C|nr:flippase activity-associated protein Agl23 [Halolamina sediminis]
MDRSSLPDALRRTDDTVRAVLVVVAAGLVARLLFLGQRVAHFDEGRVAYWALHYLETGEISYRYIVHGPLAQYADARVFAVLGPTDFSMRLFVAVVGALLPLSALLFRQRLRDTETVIVAVLLAFNPIVLYYSRFYRSSLLVAAFMFVAFGFGLRAVDDARPRLLYPAFAFGALGFAAKENALVYLMCWVGAGALLLDFSLMHPRHYDSGIEAVAARVAPYADALRDPERSTDAAVWTVLTALTLLVMGYAALSGWPATAVVAALVLLVSLTMLVDVVRPDGHAIRWGGALLGSLGLFFLVSLFFYAPRTVGSGVGLWDAVFNPLRFPALLDATWGDIRPGLEYWFGGSVEPKCGEETIIGGYVCFLEHTASVLANYALVVVPFAALGFVVARYAGDRPRSLVMFAGYWGFVSILGYPLATDIRAGWIMVNAIVPLVIPAAVALGLVVRWGWQSLAAEDRVGTVLTVALLLLVTGAMLVPAASASYVNPTADDNELVQYAQPQQEFRETFDDIGAIAPTHDGTDLLVYGEELVVEPGTGGGMAPECLNLGHALPLHWYIAADDVTQQCAYNETELESQIEASQPAVVIAHVDHDDTVDAALGDGYERRQHHLRTMGREVVVYIDDEALAEAEQ